MFCFWEWNFWGWLILVYWWDEFGVIGDGCVNFKLGMGFCFECCVGFLEFWKWKDGIYEYVWLVGVGVIVWGKVVINLIMNLRVKSDFIILIISLFYKGRVLDIEIY